MRMAGSTARTASSTRVTPCELNSPVSIGWSQEAGTNDIAARLYSSCGRTRSSDADQRQLIEQVARQDREPVAEMVDPPVVVGRQAAREAVDLIALLQEEFRQIGPVLAGDPGDERTAC